MSDRALRIGLPVVMLVIAVLVWHLVVQTFALPPYVLPGPGLVATTLIAPPLIKVLYSEDRDNDGTEDVIVDTDVSEDYTRIG